MKDKLVDGLKRCSDPSNQGFGCSDCPYYSETDCTYGLTRDALDILTKLQKENESLKAELGAAQQAINSMKSKLRAAGLYSN